MKLIEDLLGTVSQFDGKINRLCVGLHWTIVESKYAGMAHTYKTDQKVEVADSGNILGRSAFELTSRLHSWIPLEASLGLAALNSLIEAQGHPGNVAETILRLARDKTVTVIGRFPFNDQVAKVAAQSYFLEMDPAPGELPPFAAEEVIPASDLSVISSTALINKTLPRLLELSRRSMAIVLGPGTPMNDVLFDYGASILAGVKVKDPDALIRSVMQGVKSFQRIAGIEPVIRGRG